MAGALHGNGAPARTGTPSVDRNLKPLNLTSPRIASRRLTRAVTLLSRAGRQLDAASRLAPDKYHADRLRFLATGLRDLSLPLVRIASRLEKAAVSDLWRDHPVGGIGDNLPRRKIDEVLVIPEVGSGR